MCFTIEDKNREEKIAQEDIEVYKIVFDRTEDTVSPPYFMMFVYTLGELYSLDGELEIYKLRVSFDETEDSIDKGFHSYTDRNHAESERVHWFGHAILIKGIVPKGSKYYINEERKEIVSNQIMLTEKII